MRIAPLENRECNRLERLRPDRLLSEPQRIVGSKGQI
jgi:hypothetical protein